MRLRYYLLLLSVFFFAACGPEAAPRENIKPVTAVPALSARTMGDPAAPIVLVEYSDYQ